MLSGSIAMSQYAVTRFTRDIDIVINLKQENVPKILEIFSGQFYLNEETVKKETAKRGMFNVIDNRSGFKVDFILLKDDPFSKCEFERKTYKKINGFSAWLITLEDLVISKIIWIQQYQSEMQIKDIQALLRNPSADKNYITEWCKKLDLQTFNLV